MPKPSDGPYVTKRHDTAKPIYVLCEDEDGPVPLLGTDIRFIMAQREGERVVSGSAVAVKEDAAVGDPDRGWVRYDWGLTDLDTAGIYDAEVKVTFAPGTAEETVETFPSGVDATHRDAYLTVIVKPDLAAQAGGAVGMTGGDDVEAAGAVV